MISLFFNETGYSIQGDGIEIVQSCSPAVDSDGKQIFPPLHHLYGVCFKALGELLRVSTQEDITVYNDSRVVDELNGIVQPYDGTCEDWSEAIHRSVLPTIKTCVLFRKKTPEFVASHISTAQEKSIVVVDPGVIIKATKAHNDSVRSKRVQAFKEKWHDKR